MLLLPPQTRREKIGRETGSSKFQLLEKDWKVWLRDRPFLFGGKKRLTLSYGNCRMWELQGGIKTKTDTYGNEFSFTSGDFILYDLEKSLNEDVKIEAVY